MLAACYGMRLGGIVHRSGARRYPPAMPTARHAIAAALARDSNCALVATALAAKVKKAMPENLALKDSSILRRMTHGTTRSR